MEVLSSCEVSLTNAEVLNFLQQENKDAKKEKRYKQTGSLATLRLELITSLESTKAKSLLEKHTDFQSWREQLSPFSLTEAEERTVFNQCPVSAVEVHLMVENSEERLKEEDVDAIVEIVRDRLGLEQKVEEEEEEEEEEGEEEEVEEAKE